MLKIRQEQIDAIVAARWDDFFSRASRHAKDAYPAVTTKLSIGWLRRVFNSSVDRAHQYGMRTEKQITCMFEASLLLGDQFETSEQHVWAKTVMQSRYLSPDDRAAVLLTTAESLSVKSST